MSDTINIIEPDAAAMTFLAGETKTLTYIVRNTSDFKVADLEFYVDSILKDGNSLKKTTDNYLKIMSSPKVLYPGKDYKVKIKVTVPIIYDEYITKDDGNKQKQPFRIKLSVKGIEHIEEI